MPSKAPIMSLSLSLAPAPKPASSTVLGEPLTLANAYGGAIFRSHFLNR